MGSRGDEKKGGGRSDVTKAKDEWVRSRGEENGGGGFSSEEM